MERMWHYDGMTKREMVETLKGRGYSRVSERMSKLTLVVILVNDDEGRIDERAW